jgi:hypothetical protein
MPSAKDLERAREIAARYHAQEARGGIGELVRPIAEAFAEIRADERERAAKIAESSNFVDGPQGTVEGQIAAAIRWGSA